MTEPTRPDVFTADYVGEPGHREFYIQFGSSGATTSYLVEKGQVLALAEKLTEILLTVDTDDPIRTAVPARDAALALVEPLEPEWRIGTIGLGYEDSTDVVVVLLQPVEEPADDAPTEPPEVQLVLERDQVRSFVIHALAMLSEGRPLCPLCGLPMDPEGHVCPASNGHKK